MARTPDPTGDGTYETPVYSGGRKYYVVGRYPNATAARKAARDQFPDGASTREPKLLRSFPPAGEKK